MEADKALNELLSKVVAALDPQSKEGAAIEAAILDSELAVCAEVIRNLGLYAPQPVPDTPPELLRFASMTFDEMRDALTGPVGPIFASFRFEVTEIEAANSQRLHVLASTFQSLARLRSKAPDLGAVDRALEKVGGWIERVWSVSPLLDGDAGKLRAWSRKQTWRPDVLPYAWRGL